MNLVLIPLLDFLRLIGIITGLITGLGLVVAFFIISFIIGFIIAWVVAFFVIGFVNAILTELIWNMPVDFDWQNILSSGFYLTFGIFFVHLPALAVSVFVPIDDVLLNLARQIAFFVMYAFIDGFLGKELAPVWRDKGEEIQTA